MNIGKAKMQSMLIESSCSLLVLLVCCLDRCSATGSGLFSQSGDTEETWENQPAKCEVITVPFCMDSSDIPYNMTIFPNFREHETQDEAGLELASFWPLVEVGCSPHLRMFLCSVYIPICTILDDPIPPCRRLCELARDGCSPIMRNFGFAWPEGLQCDNFPTSEEALQLCVHENVDESTAVSIKPTNLPDFSEMWATTEDYTAVLSEPVKDDCYIIPTELCHEILPYNYTSFPNLMNHSNEIKAMVAIHEWIPLINYGCSSLLRHFLCRVFFPPCKSSRYENTNNITTDLPCRSMCEHVQNGCNHVMDIMHFDWPSKITCDVFPVTGCNQTADGIFLGDNVKFTDEESSYEFLYPITCLSISAPQCQTVSYTTTKLPNIFGHKTQSEAKVAMEKIGSIFEQQCDNDMQTLLCNYFFPDCRKFNPLLSRITFCDTVKTKCPLFEISEDNWPNNEICDFHNDAKNIVSSLFICTFQIAFCGFIIYIKLY